MKTKLLGLFIAAALFVGISTEGYARDSLGVGIHYLETIDEIDDGSGLDEDSIAWTVVFQGGGNDFFSLDIEVVLIPDFLGSDEDLISPQILVQVGSGLYAAAGAGINYFDGEFANEPYFILRAGLAMEILPGIFLDINGNYTATGDSLEDVDEDIDTDTIMLGAFARIEL